MNQAAVDRPKGKVWTYEEYLADKVPPEVAEIVEGEEVRKMPTGDLHGWLEMEIAHKLKGLDGFFVLVGEVALLLSRSPLNLRGADIVVIDRRRWRLRGKAIDVPPDLIVEIVSPSEGVTYVLKKMEDYRRWGVKRQVWVFPKEGEVVAITQEGLEIYMADEEVELVGGVKLNLSELLEEVKYEGGDS